ncbi:MAG: AbrB/MazE/SpoVT family DNA-binding domain-containing protein [Candidatus Lokiarchaeota archaeon]|nr:AbrB/MazE/SpoVT family DNA-binding domain-containing protein [Candidatus Lokiarchaeota archaeon]
MTIEKPVKVTNHGMISIPAEIRKKYGIKDGDRVYVIEDENGIRVIPIMDMSVLREKVHMTTARMLDFMEKARKRELEIEKA